MTDGFLYEGEEWRLYGAEGAIFWFPDGVVVGEIKLLSREEVSVLSYLPFPELREKMLRGCYDNIFQPTNNIAYNFIENFGQGEW